jgi:hypothetical protein
MLGVLNRVGTAQMPWDWADVTAGAGTDSITWAFEWNADSLVWGENFVCCMPLEDQAATSNNPGIGTPFAGNLEVYPVYRVEQYMGTVEMANPEITTARLPTVVRGALYVPGDRRPETGDRVALLDIAGRKALDLRCGTNDVSRLSPGVYFVSEQSASGRQHSGSSASGVMLDASSVTKVIIQK